VIWTTVRPQERGIHVHLGVDGQRIVDDTFGIVIYKGQELDRAALMGSMVQNTVV
jgi:hypothetical protein